MRYTYKNVSDVTQSVPGVGVVDAGALIEVSEPIRNPNFELQPADGDKVIGTQMPQPGMVTDIQPVKQEGKEN